MFDKIKIIITILPLIAKTVQEIEKLFPQSGSGSVKLAMVKTILLESNDELVALWDVIEKIINSMVSVYNATGIFKK